MDRIQNEASLRQIVETRAGHKIISKPIVFGTFAVYRGKKVLET